jgi:hypothetical protein
MSQQLRVNETATLTATAINLPGTTLIWKVQVGSNDDPTGGKLTGTGGTRTYRAPPEVPKGPVTVVVEAHKPPGSKPTATISAAMVVVDRYASAHCYWDGGDKSVGCRIIEINRLKGDRGTFSFKDNHGKLVHYPLTDATPAAWIQAVIASKALVTGSVLEVKFPKGVTWIRREFHCFRWKLPENRRSSPQCLQQSIDFHKRSFNPPGVLIYEPDGVSPAPTFG